jgi:rhodanese-related sulfurtransferase
VELILKLNFMGIFDNFFGGGNATNETLAKVIAEGAFLVDVRGPGEFAGGSAKGAVNIPLDTITQHLNKFNGKKHIVVFCRSGNRSSSAKSILEQNGFKNVTNGGTWQNVTSLQK